MLQRTIRGVSQRWRRYHRLSYLRGEFRNGEELVRSLLDVTPCDAAFHRDGTVIRHPPGRTGLAGMILETWCDRIYTGRFYTPRPGDVVVDAGANVGLFSLLIARVCRGCRVLAFEPFEENYRLLGENLASAKAEAVETHPVALSGTAGEAAIIDGGERSQDHRLTSRVSDGSACTVVRTCTMPDILEMAGAEAIDLFKCDIEGSEQGFFAEAAPEALRRVRRFAIEYHDNIQPGTLRVLRDRLGPTHTLVVKPASGQSCGMLYATSKASQGAAAPAH